MPARVIQSGVIIQAINLAGWMPAITGILLIFGILRKELILVMLAAFLGTSGFGNVLTAQQMITLAVCIIEIVFAIILARSVNRVLGFFF
jgi:ferrous iron transport protein B